MNLFSRKKKDIVVEILKYREREFIYDYHYLASPVLLLAYHGFQIKIIIQIT